MHRREFLAFTGGLTSMAAADAPASRKSNYYLLENYFLRHSTQLARINQFMSRGLMASGVHQGPQIYLEALVASHLPQFMVVLGLDSPEEMLTLRKKFQASDVFNKAFAEWESGPEPPYEHFSFTLLKAADYSQEISLKPMKSGARIFELRTYHSPTRRQLAALHRRFAGPEIKIFHRVGVHPILYTETMIGANMPNLTYLTPFDSLAAREAAWDAFTADPEWIRVRKESIDADGQIASVIQISLWKAAAWSPIR